jgi:acetyl-CoA carboxylase carboxyl transferase subunit alpha
VLVARHPERPQTMDYVEMIFDEFVELHGDRAFGDDRAIRCGFARLGNFKTLLVGHQKGHTLKERQACYYGCAHPEGYRKAMRTMELAGRFGGVIRFKLTGPLPPHHFVSEQWAS